jgi:hypothetical protein
MLFYGLHELPDINVYTNTDLWYMFEGNEPKSIASLYGKGFSIYNRLSGNKKIEESPVIEEKLRSKSYDLVIYGAINKCSLYLKEVFNNYSKREVIFIDGADSDFSVPINKWVIKQTIKGKHNLLAYFLNKKYHQAIALSAKGFYFKRELRNCDRKYFYPISFAIPEKNIITQPPHKTQERAFIIPGDLSTYIYDKEADYYNDYATSKYAITTKKGGWDCLRHYEILANACIPYFPNIDKCPDYTMHLFPKNIIIETNKLIEANKLDGAIYEYYNNLLYSYTKNVLTTKNLAKYVLSITQ